MPDYDTKLVLVSLSFLWCTNYFQIETYITQSKVIKCPIQYNKLYLSSTLYYSSSNQQRLIRSFRSREVVSAVLDLGKKYFSRIKFSITVYLQISTQKT